MPPLYAFEIDQPDEVLDKRHPGMVRESLREVARVHQYVTMGKHFKETPENMPGGAYGSKQPTQKYAEWKKKKVGHTIPNVLFNRMRNSIKNNSYITATQYQATLHLKPSHAISKSVRKNIETITSQELADANRLAHEHYAKLAKDPDNIRKRKRRIV